MSGDMTPALVVTPARLTWARELAEVLGRQADQQPEWPVPADAECVVSALGSMPPIVRRAEVDQLRCRLGAVARGQVHVVRGGDCAETFADGNPAHVCGNLAVLAEVAQALAIATGRPVLRIGRLAGQYAKPRSAARDAAGLPSYRGDAVNSQTATLRLRTPDPNRMRTAYRAARATMATLRAPGGRYGDVFVSHELLLLDYERAFLRSAGNGRFYDLSAHAFWIGERTRSLGGAHIALAGLLENPIGVKIGATASPEQVIELVQRVDPHKTPGRLTLISRMGYRAVREALAPIVESVSRIGHPVIWECDPMHGNTFRTASGIKTRRLEHVIEETRGFFDVHRELGTHPGGVHLEMTGDDVAECVGGGVSQVAAGDRYTTACDPRLNAGQTRLFVDALVSAVSAYGELNIRR